MRKIRPAELALLSGTVFGMTYGSSAVHADESFELPTVTVTDNYVNVSDTDWYYNPGGDPIPEGAPTYSGSMPTQTYLDTQKAVNCAMAYSQIGPGANEGPRPGWGTYINMESGWQAAAYPDDYFATAGMYPPTFNPPGGGSWIATGAFTDPNYPFYTVVFWYSHANFAALVNTLAHEWGHQWGAIDGPSNPADPGYADPNNAYYIGDQAQKNYQEGQGSLCGGLR